MKLLGSGSVSGRSLMFAFGARLVGEKCKASSACQNRGTSFPERTALTVGQFQRVLWEKKHFHELLGVPGGGPSQINVKHAANPPFIITESLRPFPRLIQNQVERIRRLFAGEQSEVNATAEDRINKSCGVACQQPAIAGKLVVSIRKISGRINFRHAPGSVPSIRSRPVVLQCSEPGLASGLIFMLLNFSASMTTPMLVVFPAERDHPEPGILCPNHPREGSVGSFLTSDIVIIREEGKLVQIGKRASSVGSGCRSGSCVPSNRSHT